MDLASSAASLRQRAATFSGTPLLIVLIALFIAVAALVVIAARQRPLGFHGYANLVATKDGCVIRSNERMNVLRCVALGNNRYRVTFARSIANSVPVVSLETCCPHRVGGTISSDRDVDLRVFGGPTYPVRVTLFMP